MQNSRYLIVFGIMIAKDGFATFLDSAAASTIDLEGINIIEVTEPGKVTCWLFYVATPSLATNQPVFVLRQNQITRAEQFLLGRLMLALDENRSIGITSDSFFVDTKESDVKVIRCVTEQERRDVIRKYSKARVGDTEKEINQSREIRKACRLGKSNFAKTLDKRDHDPEDKSGLSGDLGFLLLAEEKAGVRLEEREKKVGGLGWIMNGGIGAWQRLQRDKNRLLIREVQQFRGSGLCVRKRRLPQTGPVIGPTAFRPNFQPLLSRETKAKKVRVDANPDGKLSFDSSNAKRECTSGRDSDEDGGGDNDEFCHDVDELDDDVDKISDTDIFGDKDD